MSRYTTGVRTLSLVLVLVASLAALGCQTHSSSPTAPEVSLQPAGQPNFVKILHGKTSTLRPQTTTVTSAVVSAVNGGTVSSEFVDLNFPPGALTSDTQIEIHMTDPEQLVFELEPHGIQFGENVEIIIHLEGTSAQGNAGSTSIQWLNDGSGTWEPIDMLPPADTNTTNGVLRHFSKYGDVIG